MMDTRDALAAFFLGKEPFGGFGIARLAEYSWPIHDTFRAAYPDLPAGDGYRQNVELKRALTRSWDSASPDQRIELVHMIVAVWGGIRGNRPMKLLAHRDLAMNPRSDLPFAGVASYSKVLSIVAPDDYAIFDARVAAALNAIMMMARLLIVTEN